MRLLVLLALVGCEAESRGSFVLRPELGATERGLDPDVPLLFLNRCEGGCTIYPGADDSRTNHSSIVSSETFISPYPHTDVEWKQTLRCVQELYEPFEIQVTDEDPRDFPHVESIVAGYPQEIGAAGIAGVAPFACDVVPNGINFNFAGIIDNPIYLCYVVGQESGHTFGLDHQLLCSDPMTYLPSCGEKEFRRVDAECGEFFPRDCYCGGKIQNSYLWLLKELGPRVTPVDYGPLVDIVVPEDEEEVQPLFRVFADVEEDHGVDRVEAFIDGVAIGTTTIAPYGFITPSDLALGEHEIRVRAYDTAGQEDEDRIVVTLVPRPPRPDAGVFDAGDFPGRKERVEVDASIGEGPPITTDGGCTCIGYGTASPWLLLGLLFLRRRFGSRSGEALAPVSARFARCALRLLIFHSLLLAGCSDEGTITRVAPIAVLRPPPGTELSFDEVILGKTTAGPLIVSTKNKGDSALTVSARLSSKGAIRVSSFRDRVEPGDTGEVFLRFEPVVHGLSETELVIETNDPLLPEARYPVRGAARERCALSAWPTYQRFLLHEIREVSVFNDSLSPCELTRLFMEDQLFVLVDPPPLPYVIPPLGELKLRAEHVKRTDIPGAPVRQLHIADADDTEILVSFEGALPIWSCLGAFPRTLEFPDTDLGVEGRADATVYSACDEDAIISSAHVGIGYYFFDVDQRQFPVTVPAFGEAKVTIDYLPFSEHGDDGRLTINTDDALNRQMRVQLTGKAVIPELLTVPVIELGTAVPGCSERIERVPFLAIGEARTILTSLRLEGSDAFTIEGFLVDGSLLADPTPPITIPKGSSGHVLVRFAPVRSDPVQEATLIADHNGRDLTRTVLLRGRTTSGGMESETFVAPSTAAIDLLMVIDDSRSMEEEQDRLQAAAGVLMSAMDTSSFHFATMAGSDEERAPGWPYSCPPHPDFVDRSYADRLSAVTCALRVGYSSEKRRAPFSAAIRGLSRAIDPIETPNPLATFLRPEADLALVFVSDEDDGSLASNLAFRDFLYSVKGSYRPDRVRVHAIAGDPAVPCADDPWLTPGERFVRIARETGGTFSDICASDYSSLFSTLTNAIFAARDRFDLAKPADPASLQVYVDGTLALENAIDGWTYDAQANAVKLHGASRPSPGDVVTIDYLDACR